MPLTYDTSTIPTSVTMSGDDLNPVTQALIMATQLIGQRTITVGNAAEFYARIHLHEVLAGALLVNSEGPRWITAADVRDHIGLVTNSNVQTNAVFRKNRINFAMTSFTRDYDRTAEDVETTIRRIWPAAAFVAFGELGIQNAEGMWLADSHHLKDLGIDLMELISQRRDTAVQDPLRPKVRLIAITTSNL